MAPTAICPSYAFGRRMRVTKLDGCGRPVAGARSVVVTKAFTEVDISPNILTGDEITVKNAGGELCISDKALDQIKWLTVKITMCSQDPDLISLLNPTYYEEVDENANPIGYRMDLTTTYASGFALELWTDATGVDFCASSTAQGQWGYLLLPFCQGGAPGDLTVSNKEVLTIWNGRTLANPKWGIGPYNVRQDPNGNPKPLLSPITNTQPLAFFATSLSPPAAACGAQPLPATQLPTPSGLAQVGTGTQSAVTAFWTSIAGAQGYTLTFHPTSGPNVVQTFPGTVTQGTIGGLTAGTTYSVTIVADGDGINSLNSNPSTAVNMSTATANPMNPPVPVAGTPAPTNSSFVAQWPPVTLPAPAAGYTATATSSGQPTLTGVINTSVSPVTATFSGAVASKTYAVTAVSLGDGIVTSNSAPSSPALNLTTANTVTVTGVPASISWVHGTAITNITPAATDTGTPTTFAWTVSPALPAGVSIASGTGVISGTPTTAQASANYTVTATETGAGSGTPPAFGSQTIAITIT